MVRQYTNFFKIRNEFHKKVIAITFQMLSDEL